MKTQIGGVIVTSSCGAHKAEWKAYLVTTTATAAAKASSTAGRTTPVALTVSTALPAPSHKVCQPCIPADTKAD